MTGEAHLAPDIGDTQEADIDAVRFTFMRVMAAPALDGRAVTSGGEGAGVQNHVGLFPDLGLTGLSTYGPRLTAAPVAGLVQANTHVDIMRWDAPRGFLGETEALGLLCDHLRARRDAAEGVAVDPSEPTGLLTHHLQHDEAAWSFLARLVPLLGRHAATRAMTAAEVFGTIAEPNSGAGA